MALSSNNFIEGIDPTGTFGGYASVLLQLIRQAQPGTTQGIILYDNTPPDVSGTNAWRKRCLWLDTTSLSALTLNVYRDSGSPGWVSIFSNIPDDAITTDMIADAAVTIAKLSPSSGLAAQLIRVNAGATAFEFKNFADLFTAGVVPLSSLVTTAASAGADAFLGSYNKGAVSWYSGDDIAATFTAGALDESVIAKDGSTAAAKSKFVTCRTADASAAWRYFVPSEDIDDNALSGVKLTAASVTLNKLGQSSATTGQVATWDGSAWVPQTPAGTVSFYTGTGALPTVAGLGGATSFTHGLGSIPRHVYVRLKCITPEYGYAAGDCIDLNNAYSSYGAPVFYVNIVDATTVRVSCGAGVFPGFCYVIHQATGVYNQVLTPANWELEVNCIK